MIKKALIAFVAVVVVAGAGLWFWARSILASDTVRAAVATQISKAIGQPVTIGTIGATIFPRVTMTLGHVEIGKPGQVTVTSLLVGTDFRALLSRRIEHAVVRLQGAHVQLPLPELTLGTSEPASTSAPAVEIVSIDEIVFQDVEVVSGGRTLHATLELVPHGVGAEIRAVSLATADTTISLTGRIDDFAGPTGELTAKAQTLDIPALMAFLADFSTGAGINTTAASSPTPGAAGAPSAAPSAMNLAVTLTADRVRFGTLALGDVNGRVRITGANVTIDPAQFSVLGGKYDGTLALSMAQVPEFRLRANLTGVDMGAAMKFAGSPDTLTGRLSGKLDLTGRGTAAADVLRTAQGSAQIDIVNGTITGLGRVRSAVIATSGRADALTQSQGGSSIEPFSRMAATIAIGGGVARTDNLKVDSRDVLLSAKGTVALDGRAINLVGQVQLSDELSRQAGRDLVRYTQDQGRVTLPATVTGSADDPHVKVDIASVAKRAITNRANEEGKKAIQRGLGSLFGR